MHLIVYGPEGSGKGTQAKLLSDRFKLPIYTSGDLVRFAAKGDQSEVGEACRKALTTGTYVADKIMFRLWRKKLTTTQSISGFILDGFPRNVHQAQFLFDVVYSVGYKIDRVIYLKLNDKKAQVRLLARARPLFEGSKLLHDSPDKINQRLKVYRQQETELLNFYEHKKILLTIDADKSVQSVFKSILIGFDSQE